MLSFSNIKLLLFILFIGFCCAMYCKLLYLHDVIYNSKQLSRESCALGFTYLFNSPYCNVLIHYYGAPERYKKVVVTDIIIGSEKGLYFFKEGYVLEYDYTTLYVKIINFLFFIFYSIKPLVELLTFYVYITFDNNSDKTKLVS